MVGGSGEEHLCYLCARLAEVALAAWSAFSALLATHVVTNPDGNLDRFSLAVGRWG